MKTTVKARNVELSGRLRSQIERKLRRLDRIAHDDAEASLELTANASRATDTVNRAEVTLLSLGSVLRSASSGPTIIAAVDRLLDKLERQLIRARERPRAIRGRHADAAQAVLDEAGRFAAEELAPINRSGDEQRAQLIDGAVVLPPGWKEAYSKFVESGWNALPSPTEFGGQGLPVAVADTELSGF